MRTYDSWGGRTISLIHSVIKLREGDRRRRAVVIINRDRGKGSDTHYNTVYSRRRHVYSTYILCVYVKRASMIFSPYLTRSGIDEWGTILLYEPTSNKYRL